MSNKQKQRRKNQKSQKQGLLKKDLKCEECNVFRMLKKKINPSNYHTLEWGVELMSDVEVCEGVNDIEFTKLIEKGHTVRAVFWLLEKPLPNEATISLWEFSKSPGREDLRYNITPYMKLSYYTQNTFHQYCHNSITQWTPPGSCMYSFCTDILEKSTFTTQRPFDGISIKSNTAMKNKIHVLYLYDFCRAPPIGSSTKCQFAKNKCSYCDKK